jgi:hypothetical protein
VDHLHGNVELQNDYAWEMMWSPYDPPTYEIVLDKIKDTDVVLEIGAGDLRLSRLMAQVSKQVYAIEIQKEILKQNKQALAKNLTFFHGDARVIPFPPFISVGVLLMRHCMHFQLYAEKLKAAGCKRLITNARWRLGVEEISLEIERVPYHCLEMGWYACWCGAAGFKPGPAASFSPEMDAMINEVINCPHCKPGDNSEMMKRAEVVSKL